MEYYNLYYIVPIIIIFVTTGQYLINNFSDGIHENVLNRKSMYAKKTTKHKTKQLMGEFSLSNIMDLATNLIDDPSANNLKNVMSGFTEGLTKENNSTPSTVTVEEIMSDDEDITESLLLANK